MTKILHMSATVETIADFLNALETTGAFDCTYGVKDHEHRWPEVGDVFSIAPVGASGGGIAILAWVQSVEPAGTSGFSKLPCAHVTAGKRTYAAMIASRLALPPPVVPAITSY